MKLTWLGQAGWLICDLTGTQIMIDPYLSDSLCERNGERFKRQTVLRPELLSTQLDVLILTHNHADHLDWATLRPLFAAQKKPLYVLGPKSVWEELRRENPWNNELVLFQAGTQYTVGDICFTSVFAAHSDPSAIGVVMDTEGKRIYHTGDTLYHKNLINSDTIGADALLVSMNGKGNNMNAVDAARLTRKLRPRLAIPMHWDMFASMGCSPMPYQELLQEDATEVRIIPAYEEVIL